MNVTLAKQLAGLILSFGLLFNLITLPVNASPRQASSGIRSKSRAAAHPDHSHSHDPAPNMTQHIEERDSEAFLGNADGAPPPAPTPTPTNGQIAFARADTDYTLNGIYLINPDGSGETKIPRTEFDYTPVWSPDGTCLAVAHIASTHSGNVTGWGVDIIKPDGTGRVRLNENMLPYDRISWSPDGQKIAYTSWSQQDSNADIMVMNADGSNIVNLTNNAAYDYLPSWSPDGTKILFASDRTGNQDIFVMDADGSNVLNLTNYFSIEYTPSWSPDGTKILFVGDNRGPFFDQSGVFVMNSDGTNVTFLNTSVPAAGGIMPAWSPDGTKVVFSSDRDGNRDIYSINADGTGETRVTTATSQDNWASWQPTGVPPLSIPTPSPTPTPSTDADLLATASVVPNVVEPNGTIFFNSAATNLGPAQADNVNVDVIVPLSLIINNIDAPGGTCTTSLAPQSAGYDVSCAFGSVGSGEFRGVGITATVNAVDGTTLLAVATVSSTSPDPVADNNTASASAIVYTPPPPSANITVSSGVNRLTANGSTVSHTVNVSNYGPSTASNVNLTIQIPPGATFGTATNSNGSCAASAPDANGTSVTCTLGDIAANAVKGMTETATVTGTPYAVLPFISTASSDTPDPDLQNNVSRAPCQIFGPPVPLPTPATGDNPLIAFRTRRDGNGEIYTRRADGTAQKNLTNTPAEEEDFVWSPDGSKIAFTRIVTDNDSNRDLFVMNADGSNLLQLTNSPNDVDGHAVWSPDSSKLLFTSASTVSQTSALWVTNADGTNQIRIGVAAFDYEEDPAWSPDGTMIAFVRHHFDGVSPTTRTIYTANADGSNQIALQHGLAEYDFAPVWSSDGTQINFMRVRESRINGETLDIYSMNADGTNQQNLTNLGTLYEQAPVWSPDRSKVAFVNGQIGNQDVYVMNADGSNRVNVFHTTTDYLYLQDWSPDNTKALFHTIFSQGIGAGVYVVNASDGSTVHIGGDAEYNNYPSWSPDSQRIAFNSLRNGGPSIDIANADGTGRIDLTNDPAYYTQPKWQPRVNTPAGNNVTVAAGGVALTFSNVTQAGQTTVTPIDPNSLTGLPGEYVINADSLAFEVHTTALYSGPITLGFQVPGITNPITFSALRVLHGEPPPIPNFVDRTVLAPDTPAPDFATRTIYARVSSLSPFVVAQRKDTTPPVTTATLSAQPNAAGWHKANLSITLAATDNAGGSGVQSLTYSATGAQPIAQTTVNGSTATIAVTTQGTTTITYLAQDVDGNVEAVKTVTVKLDKTAPSATTSTVNSTPNSSGYYNGLNGPVALTLSASDLPTGNASGIAGFFVSATGAQVIPANTFVAASNPVVQITTDGTTTLSYRAVDNAGNEGATASRTLKVDVTAPTTSYTVSSAGSNITLTVNCHDNLSGYAVVNFNVNDGPWQVFTGPFPSNGTFSYTFNGPYHESGSYTLKYYGTDVAGNKESTKTVTFTIPPQAITPTLASVKKNSNGTYTATFGYRNDNPLTFNIAVGASNNFSPGSQSRGQTTAFQTGTVANAFTVTWDGSSLTWNLKGPDGQTRQVTARKP